MKKEHIQAIQQIKELLFRAENDLLSPADQDCLSAITALSCFPNLTVKYVMAKCRQSRECGVFRIGDPEQEKYLFSQRLFTLASKYVKTLHVTQDQGMYRVVLPVILPKEAIKITDKGFEVVDFF